MTTYHDPPTEGMTSISLRVRSAARRREIEHRGDLVLPPPAKTATACTGDEPWFPGGAKAWLNRAKAGDWKARATAAIGPRIDATGKMAEEACRTVCVALVAPDGHRVIVEYRWTPNPKTPWKLVDILDTRGALLNSKDLTKEMNGT